MTRHDDAVVSVVPAIRLASVTVLQHSFAYDYGLATAEASKLFQPYEPRRDLFAGASLLDQGPKTSLRRNFKGQAMKAMKRSTAEDVSRPPRSTRLILSIMREGSLTRSNGILSRHQRNSMR